MNEFQSEMSLTSPKKESKVALLNEIRGGIQGIINEVAKKASDNKTAVETVHGVNSDVLDAVSNARSPVRPTSMEHLVEDEVDGYFHNSDVPMAQSVGGDYIRSSKNNRYRSPSHKHENSIQTGFGSPSLYKSPEAYGFISPPSNYSNKMRSPDQRQNYEDVHEQRVYRSPSGFNIGAERQGNVTDTAHFASPNRKYLPQDDHFYQDESNYDVQSLRSPNKIIPEQPLHTFSRDDLALLTEDLRVKFNDEIRRNNALFEKCNELQHENTSLRVASRKSSQQISYGTKENGQTSILRNAKGSNFNNSGVGGIDVLAELERLKQENEFLRKDTLRYLGKNH